MWHAVADKAGYYVTEEAQLPGRQARHRPIPSGLHPRVRTLLEGRFPNGLYLHQSAAVGDALQGQDVCLATSTASGKSLVFMVTASHILCTQSDAAVLVLYPAKALIMDQLSKWKRLLQPLDLKVCHIHGDVPVDGRTAMLQAHQVVLMTPDVAHAWMMSNLEKPEVASFLRRLRLLVLDEAHVYDGVFGSNMAFFLRRLAAVAAEHRMIITTATLGEPDRFTEKLTGRKFRIYGVDDDGAGTPEKTVATIGEDNADTFEAKADLIRGLARLGKRFLAFADSRRMVEQIVAAARREGDVSMTDLGDEPEGAEEVPDDEENAGPQTVLPYRAGYEEEDRKEIQRALEEGRLAGVVATSALELGLDIGELNTVVLLSLPPTMKALWQRLGRAGRRESGTCLIVDSRRIIANMHGGLNRYLRRPLEPNWLYLDNRYIQYTNALCAAREGAGRPSYEDSPAFASLPEFFSRFLQNELNPREVVPSDLMPLKQQAEGGPQREFPIRTGIEPNFQVRCPMAHLPLGNLTYSQALREAYPGAIYYYMAKPYRVYSFRFRLGEILAKRVRRWTTSPLSQVMVFPKIAGGCHSLLKSANGFVIEADVQVSERVLGFRERRGANQAEHRYGPGSEYYHRPLSRFFQTTGVCWHFPSQSSASSAVADALLSVYCMEYGIERRDLGVGMFHLAPSQLNEQPLQGMCVFDATNGSLRLTQRFAAEFDAIVHAAARLASRVPSELPCTAYDLMQLGMETGGLRSVAAPEPATRSTDEASDWVLVVAPGERALYLAEGQSIVVDVITHRYTPRGLLYQLKRDDGQEAQWFVAADHIVPINGETLLLRVNLLTGETEDV